MPIANCFIDSPPDDPEGVVRASSDRSGIAPDEMTVNLIHMRQGGKRYPVMAWLYLPSLWSDEDVVTLSEILACGVFGHATDEDIHRTVDLLPTLCAPGATVVWTRGGFQPDLRPTIRSWFAAAGFVGSGFLHRCERWRPQR